MRQQPRAGAVGRELPSNAGLTLLEVLAALSVFLVGEVGVISLLTTGTRLHQQSQKMTIATDMANYVALLVQDEVALTGINEQTGLPPGAAAKEVPGHDDLKYSYDVIAGEQSPPYRLDIRIHWKEGGKERIYTFQRVLPSVRPMVREIRKMASRDDA